jgi:hypothetical protein
VHRYRKSIVFETRKIKHGFVNLKYRFVNLLINHEKSKILDKNLTFIYNTVFSGKRRGYRILLATKERGWETGMGNTP